MIYTKDRRCGGQSLPPPSFTPAESGSSTSRASSGPLPSDPASRSSDPFSGSAGGSEDSPAKRPGRPARTGVSGRLPFLRRGSLPGFLPDRPHRSRNGTASAGHRPVPSAVRRARRGQSRPGFRGWIPDFRGRKRLSTDLAKRRGGSGVPVPSSGGWWPHASSRVFFPAPLPARSRDRSPCPRYPESCQSSVIYLDASVCPHIGDIVP